MRNIMLFSARMPLLTATTG